jgi:hypothetical protein
MEAADMILRQLGELPKEAMSCMDLLLRWLVVRICDANTQCLLKVLDLTKALFLLMIDQVRSPRLHLYTADIQGCIIRDKWASRTNISKKMACLVSCRQNSAHRELGEGRGVKAGNGYGSMKFGTSN